MFSFLKEHSCAKGEENLCAIAGKPHGGKYFVPEERIEEFLRLIAVSSLDGCALVPQAKNRMLQAHIVDLDFDMDEEHVIPVDTYMGFFQELTEALEDEDVNCFVLIPERPFYKKRDKLHTGVHGFLCVERDVSVQESLDFRKAQLHLIEKYFGEVPTTQGKAKIWDLTIAKRNTGTTIAYTCKAECNGPKTPSIMISKVRGKIETFAGPESMEETMGDLDNRHAVMKVLYTAQLCGPKDAAPRPQPARKVSRAPKPSKPTSDVAVSIKNEDGFQGDYFLRWAVSKKWGSEVPVERNDWKLIVSYFAGCGYCPKVYGEKLTALRRAGAVSGARE